MNLRALRPARAGLWAAALAAAVPLGAAAQDQDALYVRSLAASCAACHGTQGHTIAGSPLQPLAGRPRQELLTQMQAFKAGTRPATIMHQLAKGYTDAQLEQIAAYLAAQKQ